MASKNQIGDHNPVVGGYSTQYNNEPGQGAHNPLGKGKVDPNNTKPPRPKQMDAPLNATGKK
jgi:hypothetical protein